MTDIQGFSVHLLLICASLKSPSTLQHISTSHLAELAFFAHFQAQGERHWTLFYLFYLGGLGVTFDLISWYNIFLCDLKDWKYMFAHFWPLLLMGCT